MNGALSGPVSTVGVVLPVHDEEESLPFCLRSIEAAVEALPSVLRRRVAIVLDNCGDASSDIAHRWAAQHEAFVLRRQCAKVGMARQSGCATLVGGWPDIDASEIWLATTDADSTVPVDWLTTQVEAAHSGVEMWAGRVAVTDWSGHVTTTRDRWTAQYRDEPGPIHGASLGFGAALYTDLGGFAELSSGEDRDLHNRAVAAGYRIRYDATSVVTTSARRVGRAPNGFADALGAVSQETLEAVV